jgi:hypothetical protein
LWGKTIENKPFVHIAVNRSLGGNGNDGKMLFFNGIEVIVQVRKKKSGSKPKRLTVFKKKNRKSRFVLTKLL